MILGDPGFGKSGLTQSLGELPNMEYIRTGSFVRDADPGSLVAAGGRIIVDGLDEIASAAAGGAVEAVLKQLYAWLKSTLEKIAAVHPQSRVHGMLPWAFDQASN